MQQKLWLCVGKLRIGKHVNLNPFGERRRHTGRENKVLSGKERDGRSLSQPSLLHPPQCVISQFQAAAAGEIPQRPVS